MKFFSSDLFIGWALGLTSFPITEYLRSFLDKRRFISGLRAELVEARFRLAATTYSLADQVNMAMNRDYLTWLRGEIRQYQGHHPTAEMLQGLEVLLRMDDAQLEALARQRARERTNMTISVRTINLPYLDSKIDRISYLPELAQSRLLSVRSDLSVFNEAVHQAFEWQKMTFSVETDGNYDKVAQNEQSSIERMFSIARGATDKIASLLQNAPLKSCIR